MGRIDRKTVQKTPRPYLQPFITILCLAVVLIGTALTIKHAVYEDCYERLEDQAEKDSRTLVLLLDTRFRMMEAASKHTLSPLSIVDAETLAKLGQECGASELLYLDAGGGSVFPETSALGAKELELLQNAEGRCALPLASQPEAIGLGVPVTREGRRIGTLVGIYDAEAFAPLLSAGSAHTLLTDQSGRVALRSNTLPHADEQERPSPEPGGSIIPYGSIAPNNAMQRFTLRFAGRVWQAALGSVGDTLYILAVKDQQTLTPVIWRMCILAWIGSGLMLATLAFVRRGLSARIRGKGMTASDAERELAYRWYRSALNAIPDKDKLYIELDVATMIPVCIGGKLLPRPPKLASFNSVGFRKQCISRFIYPEDVDSVKAFICREHLSHNFEEGKTHDEIECRSRAEGVRQWIRLSVDLAMDPLSGHLMAYMLFRNITADKKTILDIQSRAEMDGMTGIYNRVTAEALIERFFAQHEGAPCALMILDIDHLKGINDQMGHEMGDYAIQQMAGALKKSFRSSDIIGRLGGDEFLVFLPDMSSREILEAKLHVLVHALETIRMDGKPLCGSMGIAVGVAGRDDYRTLYHNADVALYSVKRGGRNAHAFYTADMEKSAANADS